MSVDEGMLIETVEAFSCIWDTKLKDHRNLLVVENAWKTVGTIMQESVENCKEIWKSLRAKYVRERKLIMTRPSGSAAYTGNWPLFKAISFLAPVIQTRRTSGNVSKHTTTDLKPSQDWSTVIIPEVDPSTETEVSFSQIEEQDETLRPCSQLSYEEEGLTHRDTDMSSGSSTTGLLPTPSRKESTQLQLGKKRKMPSAALSSVDNLVKSCTDVGESLNQFLRQSSDDTRKTIKNEDYYFALSLAENLSKIQNNKKKLLLKSKLLVMVAEELD